MNPLSPTIEIFLKWTFLLALGWLIHGMLRQKHARWRLILWRSILCFSIVVPLVHFSSFRLFCIPAKPIQESASEPVNLNVVSTTGNSQSDRPTQGVSSVPKTISEAPAEEIAPKRVKNSHRPITWQSALVAIWALGFILGTVRILWLYRQLQRLRETSSPANASLQHLLREVQAHFNVQRSVQLQISTAVASPFVCGLRKPVIILPTKLAEELSPEELSALLGHELAHLRQHDLFWCVGWKWMSAIFWFHPLVWPVSAAHNLACEQEADRAVSGQWTDRGFYAQLLAQLTLRVVALRPVETALTLNGTSQIVRRLHHLKKENNIWKWKHSLVGFGLAGALLLLATGWEFSDVHAADKKALAKISFKEVVIKVEDEEQQPIPGVTIRPTGLRVQGSDRASAYGWNSQKYGEAPSVMTDNVGKVSVKYPVEAFPEEKLFTGELILMVSHPNYSSVHVQEFAVDGTEKPIQLQKGIQLEVSGYTSDRQPVLELIPNVSGETTAEDWQKKENGVLSLRKLSPGGHLLQLMGRSSSGDIVYSDSVPFIAEKGKPYKFNLEMKPGIRFEGRLDDKVPRPVKNGRVIINVRPKEIPAYIPDDYRPLNVKYGYVHFWNSYRPIAEDGTFVFESIPAGEVELITHGEGFISKNGIEPQDRLHLFTGQTTTFAIPQTFRLSAPVTQMTVITEPTATLEIKAKTKWGRPVEGALVQLHPNVIRMQNGIFGSVRFSSEEPLLTIPKLPPINYSATTDKNGYAIVRNIPAMSRSLGVYHEEFEAPRNGNHRYVRVKLSPGESEKLDVTLQPKGKQFLGSTR